MRRNDVILNPSTVLRVNSVKDPVRQCLRGILRCAQNDIMVVVLLVFVASCSSRVTRPASELVETIPSDPPSLNPITTLEASSGAIMDNVYEQLIDRDRETLEWKSKLAERWEISPDHLTYTFYLRRDVRWHDGKPFTADDVIYTYERIQDPKVDAAATRNYYRDVERAEKLDDFTIRFRYRNPYFKAFEMVGGLTVIPKHIFNNGQDFNTHPMGRAPIGTGPYRFESWNTGRKIVLRRNDDYWGEKPAITALVYKIIPDTTVAFQLLKKGDLDLAGIRAVQWERQAKTKAFEKRFAKYRYYLPNFSYIGWNLERPFFSDKRVRRAMTMFLDRKSIVDKLLFGQGEIVSGSFYLFGPDNDPSVTPWPYDPKRAETLLDEAGWIDHDGDGIRDRDGIPFRFSILMPSASKLYRSVALQLREELATRGIEMEIRPMEWAAMLNLFHEKAFDAAILGWSLPVDQDPYQVWHSSQREGGSNVIGFANRQADQIIETARREFDRERRAKMYQRFHRLLHEEQPVTFLLMNPSLVVVARRFENVKEYKLGLEPLEWQVASEEAITVW